MNRVKTMRIKQLARELAEHSQTLRVFVEADGRELPVRSISLKTDEAGKHARLIISTDVETPEKTK